MSHVGPCVDAYPVHTRTTIGHCWFKIHVHRAIVSSDACACICYVHHVLAAPCYCRWYILSSHEWKKRKKQFNFQSFLHTHERRVNERRTVERQNNLLLSELCDAMSALPESTSHWFMRIFVRRKALFQSICRETHGIWLRSRAPLMAMHSIISAIKQRELWALSTLDAE